MTHRRPSTRPMLLGAALVTLFAASACSASSDQGGGASATAPAPTVAPVGPRSSAAIVPAPAWRSVTSAPTARQEVGATALDGKIWVIGGLSQQGSTATVEVYEPAADRWEAGPKLPAALHHPMAVAYRGEVVVIGGFMADDTNLYGSATDRVLALRDGAWVDLPALRRSRGAGAAATAGDEIVVVGGRADGELVATTEIFDGTRWRDAAAIPTPRDHLAAASDGRVVYAVGGRALRSANNSAAVEQYDPARDRWEALPQLPSPQGGLGAAMVSGRLVALGGENPSGNLAQVEVFDPARATWNELPRMPTPRHGIGVAEVNGTLYALDGGLEPGVAPSDVAEALRP